MKLTKNLRAFFKKLPLKQMNGQEKFLATSVFYTYGKTKTQINTAIIRKNWKKSLLGIKFHHVFYERAQSEDWIEPKEQKKGFFSVTKEGFDHFEVLSSGEIKIQTENLRKSGRLIIVNRKGTHTFDKFLRKIIATSKNYVLVVDSWVDDTIFDNVLDEISKKTDLKLIYRNKKGNFLQRARRFSTEYSKFHFKRYNFLHDRFIIADNIGYILGPSIKDAATDKPALIVVLDKKETELLTCFFKELWKKAN